MQDHLDHAAPLRGTVGRVIVDPVRRGQAAQSALVEDPKGGRNEPKTGARLVERLGSRAGRTIRRDPKPGGSHMAVGVVVEFRGGTLEQYDEVIQKMGFTPGGAGAPGFLFHWVEKTDDGFRVTDVWEAKEQFEQFAESQIGSVV